MSMYKFKKFVKRLFTPITILFIPHTSTDNVSVKMPFAGIVFFVFMCFAGVAYVLTMAVSTIEYYRMKKTLGYYSNQFTELQTTMDALKMAENDFNRLFSADSREAVLENLNTSDSGSLDMERLKSRIKETIETVGEIKDYLSRNRDIYMATPKGWPIPDGKVTSRFGVRMHPMTGQSDDHTGVDIASDPGTPVQVTADGIVSFAGYSGANGNLVVVEHGFGFKTFYAHNKKIDVHVGQTVTRGDIISYVGSTGSSTGPHLHYEIWKQDDAIDPMAYIEWKKFMAGEALQESHPEMNTKVLLAGRNQ